MDERHGIYLRRQSIGGVAGLPRGGSPYGRKANLGNWSPKERDQLAIQIREIVLEICEKEGISWVQVYGRCRSKERDRVRLLVMQESCRRTGAPPPIIARAFGCDRTTVLSALRGGRGKKSVSMPNADGDGRREPAPPQQ